jgi:hypothetical protein
VDYYILGFRVGALFFQFWNPSVSVLVYFSNLRLFMLGSKIRVGFHVHITHSPIAKHHMNTKILQKIKIMSM